MAGLLHHFRILTGNPGCIGGLTLLETVVATGLLAMLILAFSNAILTGQLALAGSEEQTIALNLAQARLETLLAQPITGASTGTGIETEAGFAYQYVVEEYGANPGHWAVSVTVHTLKAGSKGSQVTLLTLKQKGNF